jgi:Flp pilus assembly secretin CpaC
MGNHSHTTSRGERALVLLLIAGLFSLCGCHDWPDERATAIEAQDILRKLSEINKVPDPNILIPEVYKLPPKKVKQVVGGTEEWKLFYFAKFHKAEVLKQLIHEQFASKVFNEKGVSVTVQDYTVTANPETNQIIVRAPFEGDIDAVLEVIEAADVPPTQVRIECMISEIYADLTVDRETSILIENLFGEGARLSGSEDNDFIAFPGAALRDPARAKFGLKIGVSRGDAGHRFEALVDILVSRGYLKILMNPTLEVVNGRTAEITAKEHVPLQQVTVQSGGFGGVPVLTTQTEYYDIIDALKVTPHVFADGYISLETTAQITAYLTPEGIKQLPIVTERQITNEDNRIRHGESLIIGGIRKTEKRDVVRGVPILKDIPLLNLVFSGRDFEERAKEIIFILTPTISTGGRPNAEMVDYLRNRHASPMSQGLHEQVMDPLGLKAREVERQREFDRVRDAQYEAAAEATMTRLEALETGQQIEGLQLELERIRMQENQQSTAQPGREQPAKESTDPPQEQPQQNDQQLKSTD